ncbi:DEAD/DEAH box helicase family protein [Actinomyces qiguomingii]|uniref:DEAD/DEAH box helicase family protein n=1 Tax=Actinomyces qiguomingii TaxID=2057800 RepID=UPI000CA022EC|nr:DEAD/DEAH box helicase family protein [Actinomyces qiguomingii]
MPRTSCGASDPQRPLSGWKLTVPLRDYQADLLRAVEPADGARLHLVAPPGSGKTLIGLALARANGRRALVLTPTALIRQQWCEQARAYFRDAAGGPPRVRDDLTRGEDAPQDDSGAPVPADLTVLTYQSLAVVDTSAPWRAAARRRWLEELIDSGQTPGRAESWLEELAANNPAAYRSGISRRASAIRSSLASLDAEDLASLLHPAARRRIDALVDAGVATVVVDECHHLRAHWAAVVHYLLARLKAAGAQPCLLGLTATLPSPEDRSLGRYRALLGKVDYEIPVPAVVRAGCLAPSRSLVRFTLPDPQEQAFLAQAGAELEHRLDELLLSPDGIDFLVHTVAPAVEDLAEPLGMDDGALTARMVSGFDADPQAATAAGALLRNRLGAYNPTEQTTALVPLLPATRLLDVDETLELLGRYALTRLLPDPARRGQWEDTKELLAGYGYRLTDSGLRSGRSPQDAVCAASLAKDVAVADILHAEYTCLGQRLRAVVVTDAAERSAAHRALDAVGPRAASGEQATHGGALRCFTTLLTDALVRELHPVLLTGRHLQLASADHELLDRLRADTGLELPAVDDGWTLRVRGAQAGSARLVRAVSALMDQGVVRLVVGTRGLLGEGWDCPAVNTLIDLTTVTTATSVQQLRGRTLRLDSNWPAKVAHNWSVTCLLPRQAGAGAGSDLDRLRRRHEYLWSAVPDSAAAIRTGLEAALEPRQRRLLDAVRHGADAEAIGALNAATTLGPREWERRAWNAPPPVGAASGRDSDLERMGQEAQLVSLASADGLIRRGDPVELWRGAALSVMAGLIAAERIGTDIRALSLTESGVARIAFIGGVDTDRRLVAQTLVELASAPRRAPRFVLEVPRWTLRAACAPGRLRRLLGHGLDALDRARGRDRLYLAVPRTLGRSRRVVTAFVETWVTQIGPCRLRLVREEEDLWALVAARGPLGAGELVQVKRARTWIDLPAAQSR